MFNQGIIIVYYLIMYVLFSDLATIVESLTLGAESNNCMTDLGNTSFTNMEMGPTSITDITKPYPAKEPVPEANSQEVSNYFLVILFGVIFSIRTISIELFLTLNTRMDIWTLVNILCDS